MRSKSSCCPGSYCFTTVDRKSYYSPLSACSSIGTLEWCWTKWLYIFNALPQAGGQRASTPRVVHGLSLVPSNSRPKRCCRGDSRGAQGLFPYASLKVRCGFRSECKKKNIGRCARSRRTWNQSVFGPLRVSRLCFKACAAHLALWSLKQKKKGKKIWWEFESTTWSN